MAKDNFTDSTIKEKYRTLVPTKTLSKVTVASNEKRDRAELLDIVEDLFQTKSGGITAEKLRAVLHILVKSVGNTSDDTSLGIGTSSTTALAGDTKLVGIGSATTLSFGEMITAGSKGSTSYSIVMTATKGGVSKSTTLTLT
mgnify:FL=1|tara:strand:- start:89 stop:514 length:426 start_codon:yes stop_codon:yes gene_type:complete